MESVNNKVNEEDKMQLHHILLSVPFSITSLVFMVSSLFNKPLYICLIAALLFGIVLIFILDNEYKSAKCS